MSDNFDPALLDWSKGDGLIPAIVQDAHSLRVLMLGYVNAESLRQTLDTGLVTFFSRSKQRLWQKGETSGNILRLRDIRMDCDRDTILMMAEAAGPTCHLGTQSCFGEDATPSIAILADLNATIRQRRQSPQEGSYTTQMFAAGITRIAQKVGEEGVETALAAATHSPDLPSEAADLLYHLMILLQAADMDLTDALEILQQRAQDRK